MYRTETNANTVAALNSVFMSRLSPSRVDGLRPSQYKNNGLNIYLFLRNEVLECRRDLNLTKDLAVDERVAVLDGGLIGSE